MKLDCFLSAEGVALSCSWEMVVLTGLQVDLRG